MKHWKTMWPFKSKEILIITQSGVIDTQHISLRPTRFCLNLLVLSIAIWIGAVNYQVNVAYALCFWLVGFIIIGMLLAKRQLTGLRVSLSFTDEVFVGETANIQVHLNDDTTKRTRLMWFRGECEKQVTNWQRIEFSDINSSIIQTIWTIQMVQRGHFPSNLFVKLATSAPFGLFQAECQIQWLTDAVVFAEPIPHQDFGMGSSIDDRQPFRRVNMQADDIAYLKKHQDGVGLQYVAWKVYAKRQELFSKVFDEQATMTSNEIISYRDYPISTPIDKLAGLLTYRVLQADKLGVVYTLELPNAVFKPQNGLREKCLNALALM